MRLSGWWLNYRIKRLDRRIRRLIEKCRRKDEWGEDNSKETVKLLNTYAVSDELIYQKTIRERD